MKAVKIIFLFLLLAIVLTFAYQNLESVNVTFITWSITVPFSLTIFLSFIIGVLAGGLVVFSIKKRKEEESNLDQKTTKSDKAEHFA